MDSIDESTIAQFERAADLPLPEHERIVIAPMYRGLVEAANELSRKMSNPRYRTLGPTFKFVHSHLEENEE
jgi:hypothetical protein